MTTTSPLLGTNLWDSGITQPDLVFNDAIRQYDALIAGLILSRTTDAEPGSPSEGDAYIMTGSASGTDWATFDEHDIAVFSGAVWKQYAPGGRVQMLVDDDNEIVYWTGSAWAVGVVLTADSKISDPAGGGTVDAEARTAINAIIDALESHGITATS
jgi:hypothetical protein